MENAIKYTIIICGYNIEDYIEAAIKSILKQDYSNYEIIIVNDGSTDMTLDKMKKYERDNVIIVDNATNKGLGASRNIAIQLAKGDYILYLDGDDTMYDKQTLSKINEIVQKEQADITFFGVQYIGGDNKVHLSNAENSTKEARLSCDVFFGVPSKCWKKEFLIKNNITFIEDIYYEDMIYSVKGTILAEKLSYGEFPIFKYYKNRPGSIMSTPNIRRCTDMYKMLAYMFELYKITPQKYKKYVLSFIKNETMSLPKRIDAILESIENETNAPIFPKRNYQLIE
ncbi:MAG: glycosyltransferase family 2 protein [Clostridia bacterium]|nr:glycosyltransferase family 2 protein [Clostridia bacterium]